MNWSLVQTWHFVGYATTFQISSRSLKKYFWKSWHQHDQQNQRLRHPETNSSLFSTSSWKLSTPQNTLTTCFVRGSTFNEHMLILMEPWSVSTPECPIFTFEILGLSNLYIQRPPSWNKLMSISCYLEIVIKLILFNVYFRFKYCCLLSLFLRIVAVTVWLHF